MIDATVYVQPVLHGFIVHLTMMSMHTGNERYWVCLRAVPRC